MTTMRNKSSTNINRDLVDNLPLQRPGAVTTNTEGGSCHNNASGDQDVVWDPPRQRLWGGNDAQVSSSSVRTQTRFSPEISHDERKRGGGTFNNVSMEESGTWGIAVFGSGQMLGKAFARGTHTPTNILGSMSMCHPQAPTRHEAPRGSNQRE